jgi:hypothetical protein
MQLSPFTITPEILGQLSPKDAVIAFRDLLFATARRRGFPLTNVSISCTDNIADGGVDASILGDSSHTADTLLTPGTRFQIKAGQKVKPWQKSWVREELFGKKSPHVDNLGTGVRRCLKECGRYVLVCFAIDPVDEQIRDARDNVVACFENIGFPNVQVEIWGQTQLIGLFGEFPGLCLRLSGRVGSAIQCHETWASTEQMSSKFHIGDEQQQLIDRIRDVLRNSSTRHIRLIGEAGVGKTRLALEATRTDDLAPLVVYVPDGATFHQGDFFNELIRRDNHDSVVLVIDDCINKDRADIWNLLAARKQTIWLITIDHGPDNTVGDDLLTIPVTPVGEAQLIAILGDYGFGEREARRWAAFCEGSPRVAHVLGANLRRNSGDIFQNPSTIDVWDRYVIGNDDPNSEVVHLRKIVMRNLALFERFGFESPVECEAQFIRTLAAECDSRCTWAQFQSLVKELRERRVLQGSTTLYISPRLLHLYLLREFWENHGRGLDLTRMLQCMPPQLWKWFVEMLRFAHTSDVAAKAVDRLLSDDGIIDIARFPLKPEHGRLLRALAETNPRSTLRCIQRTINAMDEVRLHGSSGMFQELVWTLELLAVWEECFCDAAMLLLKLAEMHTSPASNSASQTFQGLFTLVPGMAATKAVPRDRLVVLCSALKSSSSIRRRIALGACQTALSTRGGTRMMGPEHQGLRPTIHFWMPKTYGELWDEYEAVWDLLSQMLTDWTGEDREILTKTLIDAADSAFAIRRLTYKVLAALESIADDPATNVASLVRFVSRQLSHMPPNLSRDTAARLRALSERLNGHDFASRMRRFVRFACYEDWPTSISTHPSLGQTVLNELSEEAVASPHLLEQELPWLLCESSWAAFQLAYLVGRLDSLRAFLPMLLSNQTQYGNSSCGTALSGYFRAIYEYDANEWERTLIGLSVHKLLRHLIPDIVFQTGLTEAAVHHVIQLCRTGEIEPASLEKWRFSPKLRELSRSTMIDLLEFQMREGTQLWHNAVQMCDTYFLHDAAPDLPENLVFRILTHPDLGDERRHNSLSYYWGRLATALLARYPQHKWKFFSAVLMVASQKVSTLADLDKTNERVLTKIVMSDPDRAWKAIGDEWTRIGRGDLYGLQDWLSDDSHRSIGVEVTGLLQYFPSTTLFNWIDQDVAERGSWIAGALAKTLDSTKAGRLTRDFVARYGSVSVVNAAICKRFNCREWIGSESGLYRRQRDEARSWLADEHDPTVIGWLRGYVESVTLDINRAEIEEERRL